MAVFGGLTQLMGRGREANLARAEKSDTPIRLLKVVGNFAPGGTERQVYNLVRELDTTRFSLQFVCLEKTGSYVEEYQRRGIPVTEFRPGRLYAPTFVPRLLRLARWMRVRDFQIVHAYNFYSLAFAVPAARLAGVPLVLASIRDRGVYLSPWKRKLQKAVCKLADGILVNADSIRDWLVEEGYDPRNIKVIKNGIDLSVYDGREKCASGAGLREQWRLPRKAPLVVMLARLDRQKGVEDLIRAAATVVRRHPDVHFLMVGQPTYSCVRVDASGRSEMRDWLDLIEQLGLKERIRFCGHCDDVPALLSEAALSVLPSHNEGLSNTLLESMAAGKAIVTTRVGGNPELIEHETNGLLVPPSRPDALAQAICRLLGQPELANRLAAEARRKAEACFSNQRMVQETESFYREAISAS